MDLTLTIKELIGFVSFAITASGIYWKLNQKVVVLKVKIEQQEILIERETNERKELTKKFEDHSKEVKTALEANTLAIVKLNAVLDLIKEKLQK